MEKFKLEKKLIYWQQKERERRCWGDKLMGEDYEGWGEGVVGTVWNMKRFFLIILVIIEK